MPGRVVRGLTPAQEAMLFHGSLYPDSPVYTQHAMLELEGEVDLGVMRGAWTLVFRRHEALGVRFGWSEDDRPLQILNDHVDLPVEEVDLREADPAEQRAAIVSHLERERGCAFDLTDGPLHRLAFFLRADDRLTLAWSWHHLSLDLESCYRILHEVLEVYDAMRWSRPPELEDPVPFTEYLDWLANQDLREPRAYWRNALAGMPSPSSWPPAGRHGGGATAHGDLRARLAPGSSLELRDVLAEVGVSVEVAALGAWALLLGAEGGQDDVVVGLTRSNRGVLPFRLRGVVGPLMNVMPIRVGIRREAPLGSWLREIQGRVLEADQYAQVALSEVRRAGGLLPGRHLFDTVLTVSGRPPERRLNALGRSWYSMRLELREAREFPLAVDVFADDRLAVLLRHDPALVPGAEAEGVVDRFLTLLRLLKTGSRRVGHLLEALTPVRGATPTLAVTWMSGGANGGPPDEAVLGGGWDRGTLLDEGPDIDPSHDGTPRLPLELDALPNGKGESWTQTERAIARIWTRMLRVSAVGRDDDFFKAGGHSLLALRMVDDTGVRFGVELPPRCIFDSPVLRGYAALVDRARERAGATGAKAVQ